MFATEEAKVAYVISNLRGRALLWGTAEWERQTTSSASFQAFSEELCKVFGLGARSSDWNSAALRDAFCTV